MADFDLKNPKPETKGDWAAVLIAGTAGYLLDAGLNIVGFLEPAACGPLFATGALGVKKAIEAVTDRKSARNREGAAREVEIQGVIRLIDFLRSKLDLSDSPRPHIQSAVTDLEDLLEIANLRGYGHLEI